MFLSEDKIQAFIGTGEVNEDGDDLYSFLAKYDPNRYQNPSNTVDTLVFTYEEKEENGVTTKEISRLLLIKRKNHPCIGWWALPGGFVDYHENIDDAARRELCEETGIDNIEICQLKTYGEYDRDPRTRALTTAYVALVPEGSIEAKAADDASDSGWFTVKDMMVSGNCKDGLRTDMHKLMLHNEEKSFWIGADIEVQRRVGTILPQVKYKVITANKLAADHGAIILEGYHYVLSQLGSR